MHFRVSEGLRFHDFLRAVFGGGFSGRRWIFLGRVSFAAGLGALAACGCRRAVFGRANFPLKNMVQK